MIPLGGHDLCVHKDHHSCLPTLRPDGRALTLTLKRLVPAVQRELREAEERRERKRLEQHVHQLQKFEAIGRLAGGVAHDFNNLLGVILGQSEILLDRSQDQGIIRGLEMIRESAKRGASLTRQLLAFGRRQVLEPKVLSLNVILADVEKLLRRVIGEDIEIDFQMDAKLGNIKADPGQLEQVVVNLATNARTRWQRAAG